MDLYYYKEIIDKNIDLISKSDKVISFGYEWALSLENKKKNAHYCIFNDPPEKVFYERFKYDYNSLSLILLKFRIIYLIFRKRYTFEKQIKIRDLELFHISTTMNIKNFLKT